MKNLKSLKSFILRKLALRQNVSVGKNFHVGPGTVVWAPNKLIIGNDVYIGKFATLEFDGCIGDGTLIANSVGIVGRKDHDFLQIGTTVRNSRWVGDGFLDLSLQTQIGSDVWIGYGSIVLSGVTIGDSTIVAAGSVITKNVPPNSVVAGNPAKVISSRFSEPDLESHWEQLRKSGINSSFNNL